MKRAISVVAVLLVAFLLVTGCGIPKKDYEAVVAGRDTAQAQVTSLQSELTAAQSQIQTLQGDNSKLKTDLDSANSTIKNLQGDLATANNNNKNLQSNISTLQGLNSALTADLKKVKDPRHFETQAELTDWLAKDDTNTNPAYASISVMQRSLILQVKALRDGYLLPAAFYTIPGTSGYFMANRAIIGDKIYSVLSTTDAQTEIVSGIQPVTSHPLPL